MERGEIEVRLAELASSMKTLRRPVFMEFAGSPKAGKSTIIQSVDLTCRRNGLKTQVVRERAALCPLPAKGHLFFNAWTGCSGLMALLEANYSDAQLVIFDRGLFDALCWLRYQIMIENVGKKEAESFERFLLLDRWRRLIDLVVVLTCSPEVSIERENASLLTTKPGSIMNETCLSRYRAACEEAARTYGPSFRQLVTMDNSSGTAKESVLAATRLILDAMEQATHAPVAAMDQAPLASCFSDVAFAPFGGQLAPNITRLIGSARPLGRDLANLDCSKAQIVSCVVITTPDGLLLELTRQTDDPKSHLFGRKAVWIATHVTLREGQSLDLAHLQQEAARCLTEKLLLSPETSLSALGYVYDPQGPAKQHLGVVFQCRLRHDTGVDALLAREIRLNSPFAVGTATRSLSELKDDKALESWSRAIVAYYMQAASLC